mmetsp:Transcript_5039/g.16256  ORF Transcript_5039/g.16256 Transcript_5039/m.16256 type:complete len:259 (-) Transcript_5039:65-841(-)|eukprot:CAMPEP_0170739464 /NCGR_PEP_ID=MMETSP0437-20130122/5178_1 /TAXON_ID=0 /ORGANISM="Sexangularia sp." /LENGTH=258 /DNA_ID=CAMNT_0011077927 /DNA_START=24 /DNA_END=800 /DNA_ORIENTATION=-
MKSVSFFLFVLSLSLFVSLSFSAPVSARQSRFFATKRDEVATEGSGEGESESESESSLSFTDGRVCCAGDVSIVLGEYQVEPESEDSQVSDKETDEQSDEDDTEVSVTDDNEAKRMFVHLQEALASGRAHRLPKREEEGSDGEGEGTSESESESESSASDSATFSGKSEARRLVRAVRAEEEEAFLNEGLCIKQDGDMYTLCGSVEEAAAVEEGGGVASLLAESDALLAEEGLQIREASNANAMAASSFALCALIALV